MKKLILLFFVLGLFVSLPAQALLKTSYALDDEPHPFADKLYGNGIVDLLPQDSVLWIGTGYGLTKAVYHQADGQIEWNSFTDSDYLGQGGISAMAIMEGLCFTAVESFLTLPSACLRSEISRTVQIIPSKTLF